VVSHLIALTLAPSIASAQPSSVVGVVSAAAGVALSPGGEGDLLAADGPSTAVTAGVAFGGGVAHRWEIAVRGEHRSELSEVALAFGVHTRLYVEPDLPLVVPTIRAGLRAGWASGDRVIIGPHFLVGIERELIKGVVLAIELGGHATLTLPFAATASLGLTIRAI